jgi:hypothetical protein
MTPRHGHAGAIPRGVQQNDTVDEAEAMATDAAATTARDMGHPMASDGFRWLPMVSDGFRWCSHARDGANQYGRRISFTAALE